MQEQRVEPRIDRLLGDRARRREGDPVRRPFDEGLERVAVVERRAEHALPLLRLAPAILRPAAPLAACGRSVPVGVRGLGGLAILRAAGCSCSGSAASLLGRGAHHDLDLEHIGLLLPPQFANQVEIVTVDPGAQEGSRNRQANDALRALRKLHACKPARKYFGAKARLELRLDTIEGLVRSGAFGRHRVALDQITWKEKAEIGPPFDAAMHFCGSLFRIFLTSRCTPHRARPARPCPRHPGAGYAPTPNPMLYGFPRSHPYCSRDRLST